MLALPRSTSLRRYYLRPVPHPVQLLTATSTPIKIYGTKTVLLVAGRLSFHVRFYITDVKQTLLGLQDILQEDIQLHLHGTDMSTIRKGAVEEPLLFHDKHFYVEALVLPQDHQLNYLWLHYLQNKLFRTTTTVYYTTGDGEVHEQVGEAQLPRSSKPPQLPTEEERLLHELTHQPYRSWCEVCQRSKGRPAYHKRHSKDKESVIQMDYGFLQDPHLPPGSPQQRPLTILTMLETTTGLSNAILTTKKGDTQHQRQQIKKWITTNGFANSILQTDSEAAILQLGEHVSRELGLRFRASPPHSHQSNGAVERLHRTLFDQLRAVRLQWALSLGVPERLPQQSLPWLLQHSVFILNKYLVKDTGATAHQNNYHKAYNNPICQFGEAVLADTRYLVNYKLRQRNLEQKIKGIWIGKDPTTDEHLIALPPIYDNHPSVTGSIYKCRGITRLPRPNMWDTTFLATIHWPPMESMDYIEPDVTENYKYLQEHNTSTREQLAQQPPQLQPTEQPVQRPRREVVPKVPPQEPPGTTTKALPLRPPPGLEQVQPQPAVPPGLGTTSKAPPVKAPPIAPPPKPAQPQPAAGPQQHRPVGKHYSRPRPQQAGAILQQAADTTDTEVDSHYCYNMTMETKVLHLAVSEDKKEKLLQQELMLDHAVLLPSYHYHDDIERYDKDLLLKAMKKEVDKLRQKGIYEEVDSSTLSQEQLRKVVKTRWVVGDRPDPTTAADTTTGEVHASELRARFVAKGFSQHINDPMECYAATPSSTSLKGLLLLGILQGHQTTCLDISTAFINTPLPTTEPPIYVQPPAEWYYNSPTTLWRLKKAMYGLRTSPKLWQQHLGAVLRQQNLRQCKADRCLWTTPGLGVLIYVDDLLLVGEPTKIQQFIATLKATFTLKHVTTLSKEQDIRFLGKRLQLHDDNSISISLEPSYWDNMLRRYNLHGDNVKTVTTTCLEQQPLEEMEKLDPQQHKMFRTTVGQLIWASLDRPDLMYCAKLHSSRLQGPTERDLRSLKHTLRYLKGTTHYKLYIGKGLADYLPTHQPQRHCFLPAEQHSFGHTLFYRFRLGRRQNYETFYKWLALFPTWNTFELRQPHTTNCNTFICGSRIDGFEQRHGRSTTCTTTTGRTADRHVYYNLQLQQPQQEVHYPLH